MRLFLWFSNTMQVCLLMRWPKVNKKCQNIHCYQIGHLRTKIGWKCQNWKFKCDILSNFHTMCGNLRITTLFWRTLDPKMVAKKMMLPTTKRMTMMKTTPSTPSTMTNSSSNSLEKSGRVQEASQSLHEHPFSLPWKFVKKLKLSVI